MNRHLQLASVTMVDHLIVQGTRYTNGFDFINQTLKPDLSKIFDMLKTTPRTSRNRLQLNYF